MHIDSLIDFGRTLLGKPYRYRGAAPWPMDCSGYMNHIFRNFGYSLPRSSREIASVLPEVPRNEVRKGDLLFFRGRNSGNPTVGHVGLVIDVKPEGIIMLHSSTSRGIIIENINSVDYYNRRWVKAGRPAYRFTD
ncbi:MAG: C40 family peptidase [Bacteroidales bacterium]|nr:C40 family peptidase [Bacteroidales bacterium]